MADAPIAVVPVKSAWLSKINWAQGVGMAATLMVLINPKWVMDANTQVQVVAGIQGVVALVSWISRTWFNGSVSPASMPGSVA